MMSCATIAPPGIHHKNHLFSTFHRNSPPLLLHTTTTFSSSLKFHALKVHSSLQIDHHTTQQHPPLPSSSTLYPNNSTPKPRKSSSTGDPELRAVLELATNSELFELEDILFGRSYFSPLVKSISYGVDLDRFMIEEDVEEREQFINALESRFLYLAADARSTLRGWRPSYRNVLLDMREELKVPCSTKLSVEDLEVEIFIHLIRECSRDWNTAAFVKVGAGELCSMLLKGGQLISLLKISQMVSARLSGKMLLGAVKHKIDGSVMKKGLTGAATRYLGIRSLSSFLGPMLWGTFLADIVIQMLGTDYIRVLQAIYTFAQIRILRRHGLHLDKLRTGF